MKGMKEGLLHKKTHKKEVVSLQPSRSYHKATEGTGGRAWTLNKLGHQVSTTEHIKNWIEAFLKLELCYIIRIKLYFF